ncbi:hypothetical protein FRC14_000776 [Serendipita sp. 396]|nr:hypothetical protein FRC14_000776 [Serendipita sp. 396]KAG8771461.1 hypothetical protein FRC15_003397 [Serendipita sp. 397]KAG8781689.1 hypothetical protein FRC16_002807 [Serendipita sp. 398]KAG8827228.1 hypothetical protein FRC19_004747 [Serendipita sp. 401]KAG8847917.1 hypothetical protein FRB91_011328 [Serendipita sp. 411]KAG8869314.1 hypothetical protein FRC20_001703 [Serendipita sp. 405]KAG9056868.1 hypothetical protein FS842_009309 [Serendipita sp. 407]
MSRNPTYPAAYKEAQLSGAEENNYYLRNEVIKKWEAGTVTQRIPQGGDFIYAPENTADIIGEIEGLFTAVRIETNGRALSREMQTAQDEFIASIQGLYGVIDTMGEAHRKVAKGLREITDHYGSRRGVPPDDELRDAKVALTQAEKCLADIADTINENAQKMHDMSNRPRPAMKTFASTISNYYIGEALTGASALVTFGAQTATLQYNVTESHNHGTVVASSALSFFGAVCTLTAAVRFCCPDAKAYKQVEWSRTQQAMVAINDRICRLMDLLAGLDLFWRQMRKTKMNVAADDIRDLRRIINVLDHHVNQCRSLGNAIARSAQLAVPQREVSDSMLQYERHPALPPTPPGRNPPSSSSRQPVSAPRHSSHTYPPQAPPKH